jgi:predicted amidohydrolase YtcJ
MTQAEYPDLVLTGGIIHTLDPDCPVAGELAVRDGRVVAAADDLSGLRGPRTTVHELAGATVLPGLLDVHNHSALAGQADLFECTFPPTAELDEILDNVAAWSARLPGQAWVVGGNWGSGLMDRLDSADVLARFDRAAGGHPAVLRDESCHNRWANSRALHRAGIGTDTTDPTGGQIFRDATGAATGVLIEAAGILVQQALSADQPTSTADLATAAARGIELLHGYGVTAFQDAATSLQLMRALAELDHDGRLPAWVVSSMQINDFIFGTDPLGEGIIAEREANRTRHHRPDFVKIFLDGVPPARTAAFLEPYLPDKAHGCGFHGQTTMPAQELTDWLMRTATCGLSAKIHCTGDASVHMVLDAVQQVRASGHDGPRYHVAHGQFVHPDDIPRFASLDVVADISPTLWFPGVIPAAIKEVLPEERASRMQPNRSLLDAGAVVAGGSDWPVSVSPNVWEAVYGLVTRADPTGNFPGTLWPEQAITRDEAIACYTTAAAEAMGLAGTCGSLAPGRSADFVVLDADPFTVELAALPRVRAMQTWFAGSQVFSG